MYAFMASLLHDEGLPFVLLESLLDLGARSVADGLRHRPPPDPLRGTWTHALGGVVLGMLSSGLLPRPILSVDAGSSQGVVFLPIASGLIAMQVGTWLCKRGAPRRRVDRFVRAYLFALCFVLVRAALVG